MGYDNAPSKAHPSRLPGLSEQYERRRSGTAKKSRAKKKRPTPAELNDKLYAAIEATLSKHGVNWSMSMDTDDHTSIRIQILAVRV